ncbi:MAG: hypothetical protein LBT74_06445 [Acidobacteriota bacterium]|nr:hypothetical protein [Acidobacteriota bacterium]
MKRLLILMLALVLALSLVACGSGETTTAPTASSDTAETSQTTTGANSSGADLTTVEGFLTAFGLTEGDLKCANYTRLDKTTYTIDEGADYGKIKEVGAYVSKALTDDEVRAWLKQVISKLNSLSDDGKIDNVFQPGSALTADYIIEKSNGYLYQGSGYYNYNGKKVSVQICVYPNQLDSDDPNDAMLAGTLKLEWY